ncbi:hypothetical protein HYC85_002611 [Camellia sinensis]|uniref:Trichome birefringence-like N-terminal domain-containing protein n=1 Tax=Camellia sinensis TaxID=4442 RepID=A0A7J7I8U5_CAMSI|nr:hypothetical protein HYC85_002611 [Camellia sinensis]
MRGNQKTIHTTCIIVLLSTLTLYLLITLVPVNLLEISPTPWSCWSLTLTDHNNVKKNTESGERCDMFHGKWVQYPNGPYYTNESCNVIFDQQNCMKFGRPDREFLKWRWKPDNHCELPIFDAVGFLELVRGKSMAFVGDSVARNQAQSLLCLLATVVYPLDASETKDPRFRHWLYKDHNFTLATFWSPYLVKAINTYPTGPTYDRLVNLYLDQPNEDWANEIESFDYVILSASQWFFGPQIYYENHHVIGCYNCHVNNLTSLNKFYGYRKAFRTAFQALWNSQNFKGVTFLRTLSPAHFENGEWNRGGRCSRTRPATGREMRLEGDSLKFYLIQVDEMKRAVEQGARRGLKFRLLDTTEAMVLRPDGHPNHFGHWPHENVTIADCVHWCLPGPIDTWNEFLFQMLKMEMLSN